MLLMSVEDQNGYYLLFFFVIYLQIIYWNKYNLKLKKNNALWNNYDNEIYHSDKASSSKIQLELDQLKF